MRGGSRCKPTRVALIFWCLFIGIGAVAGSTAMFLAPDGSIMQMQGLLPYFQVLPFADLLFQDYVFPGIALLCVNGLTNLLAAVLLLCKKPAGIVLGGVFGVTLMLWITIQFIIFPMNFLSTAYFIFGLIQAATGYAALVFYRQERFAAETRDYPNIGTDPSRLVVCFSRLGYTRRAALEAAECSGAAFYELEAAEPTAGTLGFWWCGRYAMHRWAMPIKEPALDLSAYRHVTLCTPIWVFGICGPMRAFCQWASGKIAGADYILVHHMRAPFRSAGAEMDALLGLSGSPVRSICCRCGKRLRDETPAPQPGGKAQVPLR